MVRVPDLTAPGIRESAKTTSKTLAREAERVRRRKLEEAVNGIVKRERPPLLPIAADGWLESKTGLTPLGRAYYRQYVGKLKKHFGGRLVSDITADDIAALQRKRHVEGLSGRQINCEIATLRAILKKHKLWAGIAEDVTWLHEREDAGRALSPDDESRLLDAIAESTSPALYPFFVLSLDAGLRPSETRALRRSDLSLVWHDGAIAQGEVIVSRSKTRAGIGRVVPLTRRACAALTLWFSRFPEAGQDSYLFPFHHVGFAGNWRRPHLWGVDLNRSMGTYSYKRAYKTACAKAGVDYRLYDARHTFVTRLAENPPSAKRPSAARRPRQPADARALCPYPGARRGVMQSGRWKGRKRPSAKILRRGPHKSPHNQETATLER